MTGANGTAVALTEPEALALQVEQRDSNRCIDCQTERAKGWVPAGLNRVRCAECHVTRNTNGDRHEF